MGKKYIITKKQLNEYVKKKQAEKILYDIMQEMYDCRKYLNEGISRNKLNETIINNYKRKGLITPMVYEMLIKYDIINNNYEII